MAAATVDRVSFAVSERNSDGFLAELPILNDEICYMGTILASDYLGEIQAATDTEGLRVLGYCTEQINNADDGEYTNVRNEIVRMDNDATYPFAEGSVSRGLICYVADDQTVATRSTNYVTCGIVHDVDSDGVWVDMSPAALRQARNDGVKDVIVVTGATDYSNAATGGPICHQGRQLIICETVGATTVSLPTAVAGYRIGVSDGDASAARDVTVTAAAGDVIESFNGYSAAGKKSLNAVDELSVGFVVWEAVDATNWAAVERPADFNHWVIDNG